MNIYLASDHGGFEMKKKFFSWLQSVFTQHKIEDLGPNLLDPDDDYPDYAFMLAEKVAADDNSVGILFCRSGGGMVIAANKVKGIRAVQVANSKEAAHAKEHNNANVISLAGDWIDLETAKNSIEIFFNTQFGKGRHTRRLEKIAKYEQKN